MPSALTQPVRDQPVPPRYNIETGLAQVIDDPQRQFLHIAAGVLFDGCGDNTREFKFLPKRGHSTLWQGRTLTDEDYIELAALVRDAIDAEPCRIGPRINKLKRLLAKLEPPVEEAQTTLFPPPKPSGEPSLLYRKLRGGRRR